MELLNSIEKLINEHGSAAILRERLDLLRDQIEMLEKKAGQLEAENAALKNENLNLKNQVSALTKPQDFVEHKGALFKRKKAGGYESSAYCRKCKQPMVSFMDIHSFNCKPCDVTVNFSGEDLPQILMELSRL